MKKFTLSVLAVATSLLSCTTLASWENFIDDSEFTAKAKVNYYNISGDIKGAGLDGVRNPFPNQPPLSVSSDYEMTMDEIGTSLWADWQSGFLFDLIGVQVGMQAAAPNLHSEGSMVGSQTMMGIEMPVDEQYCRFYEGDCDEQSISKLGNANIRLRYTDGENYSQIAVGRYTPTIYNLLHRPDYTYYAMHQIYEGVSYTGHYEWSWGLIEPWVNYMTGYSSEHSTDTVDFKDDLVDEMHDGMLDGVIYDSYDEIYNVGFHTITDYFTSSASLSRAPDFLDNGIIEIYSGFPLDWFVGDFASQDRENIFKFMVKYGFEEGKGKNNSDHKTDVTEFAVGLQQGNLDFLVGMTQIGEASFRGFDTQDGYNAGGGTAVWGDMAVMNTFDNANQKTLFLVGGYDLDGVGLEGFRVQGVVASAKNTDLDKLRYDRLNITREDYTEVNVELLYTPADYQGLSYRLLLGADDNMKADGIGIFIEYNFGDYGPLHPFG